MNPERREVLDGELMDAAEPMMVAHCIRHPPGMGLRRGVAVVQPRVRAATDPCGHGSRGPRRNCSARVKLIPEFDMSLWNGSST